MTAVVFIVAVWLVLFAIKRWPSTPKPSSKPRYRGFLDTE